MSTLIITEKQKKFLLENINPKQKAEDLLTKHIKKTYPYIIKLNLKKNENVPTMVNVDVEIDLNLFYRITHTTPPKDYFEKDYLMSLLEEKNLFITSYVDPEYQNKFNEFNYKLEEKMDRFYSVLPPSMVYKKFEGADIEEFWWNSDQRVSLDFIKRWAAENEPRILKINKFYPKVNYKELNSLI